MLSPLETGIIRRSLWDAGGAGKPVVRADVWPRRAVPVPDGRLAGQVGPGSGEVLSISYMEGTFVVSEAPRPAA